MNMKAPFQLIKRIEKRDKKEADFLRELYR